MERFIKKTIICPMMIIMLLVSAFGCGKAKPEEKDGTVVFSYGDYDVKKGEVYIYINTIKDKYELMYGSDVWNEVLPAEGGDISMVDLTREEVVNSIINVKTLNTYAEEYNIEFSEEEEQQIRDRAKEFYDGLTDKNISEMELTEELVYNVYREGEIAKAVREKMIEDDPVEISDEESRMTRFYDIYFPTYRKDSSGNVTPLEDEEKSVQYQNALQVCSTLGTSELANNDSGNLDNLVQYYQLDEAGERVLSPDEIRYTYGDEVTDLLYSMDNGDYSGVVETEYGYHVFYMFELTDTEATAMRKTKLLDETIDKRIEEKIISRKNEIDKKFSYPESVDMDVYNTIELN